MGMVREQGPGVNRPRPHLGQGGQADDEVGAVLAIPEDGAALEAPHHHVVEGPGGVEPGLAWHTGSIAAFALFANVPYYEVPVLERSVESLESSVNVALPVLQPLVAQKAGQSEDDSATAAETDNNNRADL